jgi:hypothetical protein
MKRWRERARETGNDSQSIRFARSDRVSEDAGNVYSSPSMVSAVGCGLINAIDRLYMSRASFTSEHCQPCRGIDMLSVRSRRVRQHLVFVSSRTGYPAVSLESPDLTAITIWLSDHPSSRSEVKKQGGCLSSTYPDQMEVSIPELETARRRTGLGYLLLLAVVCSWTG